MVLKFYLNLSKSKERLRVDLVGMVITFIGLQNLPNPLTESNQKCSSKHYGQSTRNCFVIYHKGKTEIHPLQKL